MLECLRHVFCHLIIREERMTTHPSVRALSRSTELEGMCWDRLGGRIRMA
jgi:hypothetical protein